MAAVTLLGTATFNTNSGSKTVTATPALNDLIVIVCAHTGNTSSTGPTDNNADGLGTYTLVGTTRTKNTSADTLGIWVRDALIGNASSTVFTHAPGTTTGGGLAVHKATGMSRSGSSAIKQSAGQSNQASGGTPQAAFGSAMTSGNVFLGAVFNATNPATLTPPTGTTERVDAGYATPTAGLEIASFDSVPGGSTINWGSTSGSAFCTAAVELDASAAPTQYNRTINSTSTPPGTLARSKTKPRSVSSTPSATISTLKSFGKVLSGLTTPPASITNLKALGKTISGQSTPVSNLVRSAFINLLNSASAVATVVSSRLSTLTIQSAAGPGGQTMQQPIMMIAPDDAVNNATRYTVGLVGGVALDFWTPDSAGQPIAVNGTLSDLSVYVPTALSAGQSFEFTLMKNDAATALSCTVDSSGLTASNRINRVSVAAGDRLAVRVVPTGTPNAQLFPIPISLKFTSSNQEGVLFARSNAQTGNAASYIVPGNANGTDADVKIGVMPCAGTISKMYLRSVNTIGASTSYTVTLVKNGVDTALTLTLNNTSGQDGSIDLGGSGISFVTGDEFYFRMNTVSASTGSGIYVSTNWSPTILGEIPLITSSGNNVNSLASANSFLPINNGTVSTNYNNDNEVVVVAPESFRITRIVACVKTPPAFPQERHYWVRRGANFSSTSDTSLKVAQHDSQITVQHGGRVDAQRDDFLSIRMQSINSPPSSAQWSIALAATMVETVTLWKQTTRSAQQTTAAAAGLVRRLNRLIQQASTPPASLSKGLLYLKSFVIGSTPVAAVLRSLAKIIFIDSTPPASSVRGSVFPRVLTVVTTNTFSLLRSVGKTITRSATPAGTLSRASAWLRSVSSTPTAAVSRGMSRALSILSTPTAAVRRGMSRVLSILSTPVSTTVRQSVRIFNVSSTPFRNVLRSAAKIVAANTTPVGYFNRAVAWTRSVASTPLTSINRSISRSILFAATPVVTKVANLARSVAVLTTPLQTLVRTAAKSSVVSTTPPGTVSPIRSFLKDFSVSSTLSAAVLTARTAVQNFLVASNPVGALARVLARALNVTSTPTATGRGTLSWVRSVTTTPVVAIERAMARLIQSISTPAAALNRNATRLIAQITTPVASFIKSSLLVKSTSTTPVVTTQRAIARLVTLSIAPIGVALRSLARVVNSLQQAAASVVPTFISGVQNYERTFTATTQAAGSLVKSISRIFASAIDGLASTERLPARFRTFIASSTPVATFSRSVQFFKTVIASTTPLAAKAVGLAKTIISESTPLASTRRDLARLIEKAIDGAASMTRVLPKLISYATVPFQFIVAVRSFVRQSDVSSTPTADLSRSSARLITAVTTPVARVLKVIGRTINHALSAAAAVVRSTPKTISASAPGTATLQALKFFVRAFTRTVLPTATVARTMAKIGMVASYAYGSVRKVSSRTLTAAINTVTSYVRAVGHSISATTTPAAESLQTKLLLRTINALSDAEAKVQKQIEKIVSFDAQLESSLMRAPAIRFFVTTTPRAVLQVVKRALRAARTWITIITG